MPTDPTTAPIVYHRGLLTGLAHGLALTDKPFADFRFDTDDLQPGYAHVALGYLNEESAFLDMDIVPLELGGWRLRLATTESPVPLPDDWASRPPEGKGW